MDDFKLNIKFKKILAKCHQDPSYQAVWEGKGHSVSWMKGKSRSRANRVLQYGTGAWEPKEQLEVGLVTTPAQEWVLSLCAHLLPCLPSSSTPGCCCFFLSPCSLISAYHQLCVHLLLSSIPSNHFQASSTVRSWAEGNFFFLLRIQL